MTTEQKQLLLKDLCARLPYGVIGLYTWKNKKSYNRELTGMLYDELQSSWNSTEDSQFSPYLRPMSSMTEEEIDAYRSTGSFLHTNGIPYNLCYTNEGFNFLLSKYLDIFGLIEKGLALEAPEGMYDL